MKIRLLLLCHLLIAILLSTFLWPVTKVYWDKIDLFFFHLLNDPMENNRFLQYFWGFSNHHNADWVEDLVFLVLLVVYIYKPSSKSRTRKVAECLFSLLLMGAILYFVGRLFFRIHLRILRDSPSIVVESCVRLSQEIPWLSLKDISTKSFPADHAITAFLFASIYTFLTRNALSCIAIIYCSYVSLPRMAVGAHWLSDALVGSGTIVLFFLSWTYCTPVHRYAVDRLERFFCFFQKKKVTSKA